MPSILHFTCSVFEYLAFSFWHRFHDFGHCASRVRLPAGVRGSDGDGGGTCAGRHGAGGHGQYAGMPPPPLQVQGDAVRLGRTLLLGQRQRHVLLGTLRLQRGAFKIAYFLNFFGRKNTFSELSSHCVSISAFSLLSRDDLLMTAWCQSHSL